MTLIKISNPTQTARNDTQLRIAGKAQRPRKLKYAMSFNALEKLPKSAGSVYRALVGPLRCSVGGRKWHRLTRAQIAAHAHVSVWSVSHGLKRLESEGWIQVRRTKRQIRLRVCSERSLLEAYHAKKSAQPNVRNSHAQCVEITHSKSVPKTDLEESSSKILPKSSSEPPLADRTLSREEIMAPLLASIEASKRREAERKREAHSLAHLRPAWLRGPTQVPNSASPDAGLELANLAPAASVERGPKTKNTESGG